MAKARVQDLLKIAEDVKSVAPAFAKRLCEEAQILHRYQSSPQGKWDAECANYCARQERVAAEIAAEDRLMMFVFCFPAVLMLGLTGLFLFGAFFK